MARLQNGKLRKGTQMKWQVDINGKLAKWQTDKMASLQNDKLTKRQAGKMTS